MLARDILFYTLAGSAVALTVFLAWFLFELIRILRGVAKTVESIETKLRAVDELIALVRDKLHFASSTLASLTGVVTGVLNFIQNKRASSRKRKAADAEF